MVLVSTRPRKPFLETIVAVREPDAELIGRFVYATRALPLREVAKIIGRDEGTAQRYRTAVSKKRDPGGLRGETRSKMEAYLFAQGGSGSSYRDGVMAAVNEIRVRLEEIEQRLRAEALREEAILAGESGDLAAQYETGTLPGQADPDEQAEGGRSA